MEKLRERIECRLRSLGISQFEAGKRAGKSSHFIYDFMTGKKREFKGDGLYRVAFALECSPDYLLGLTEEVGRAPTNIEGIGHGPDWGVPLVGIVEAGAFRQSTGGRVFNERLNIPLSPQYPEDSQSAYLVRGSAMSGRGITENMILIAHDVLEDLSDLHSGSIVIVERSRRDGEEIETSARELQIYMDRIELRTVSNTEAVPTIVVKHNEKNPAEQVRVIGRVLCAVLPFA